MSYLIDTSVAIRLRDGEPAIEEQIDGLDGPILMSIVTRVELEGGLFRDASHSALRRQRLDTLLAAIPALPFDDAAADAYRAIVEAAGYSRRKLLDRMIAAQAIAHRASLVTQNGADFRDCPGLMLLEW